MLIRQPNTQSTFFEQDDERSNNNTDNKDEINFDDYLNISLSMLSYMDISVDVDGLSRNSESYIQSPSNEVYQKLIKQMTERQRSIAFN